MAQIPLFQLDWAKIKCIYWLQWPLANLTSACTHIWIYILPSNMKQKVTKLSRKMHYTCVFSDIKKWQMEVDTEREQCWQTAFDLLPKMTIILLFERRSCMCMCVYVCSVSCVHLVFHYVWVTDRTYSLVWPFSRSSETNWWLKVKEEMRKKWVWKELMG